MNSDKKIFKVEREPTIHELAEGWGLPVIQEDKPWTIDSHDYYDGPRSGFCCYQERVHYFNVRQDDWWRLIFNLFPLSDEQIERGMYDTWKLHTEHPKYSWSASKAGREEFILAKPWTDERCAAAERLPETKWIEFVKTAQPSHVFRWGTDPTPEMYDWADFVLEAAGGNVRSAGPSRGECIHIEFGYSGKRHADLEICDDGEFMATLVDNNFDSDDERWMVHNDDEDSLLNADSLRHWTEKALAFLK